MDRLRALAVLRDSTDQPVGVGQGDNHRACGSIVSAFLRVRVLPSGPWAFSSVFDVKWPRPVDWGRLSSEAGEWAAAAGINGYDGAMPHVLGERDRAINQRVLWTLRDAYSQLYTFPYGARLEVR